MAKSPSRNAAPRRGFNDVRQSFDEFFSLVESSVRFSIGYFSEASLSYQWPLRVMIFRGNGLGIESTAYTLRLRKQLVSLSSEAEYA